MRRWIGRIVVVLVVFVLGVAAGGSSPPVTEDERTRAEGLLVVLEQHEKPLLACSALLGVAMRHGASTTEVARELMRADLEAFARALEAAGHARTMESGDAEDPA